MPKLLRSALRSLWDLTLTAGPVVLIAIAILAFAYWWLDPTPPRTLRLATGPAQSAYAEFGSRYAATLQVHGVKVVQIPTAGSSENLQLLRDGGADFAFVRGGAVDPVADEEAGITSLGSLFLEPVWVFYRSEVVHKALPRPQTRAASATSDTPTQLSKLTQLKGLRINVDIPGSGVPKLVERLLALNKIDASHMKLSNLPPAEAADALLAGKLDAMVYVSAPESPIVQTLLQSKGIQLMDFGQSEAYARNLAFLSPVSLPRGIVNLAADLPPEDVGLVATTTSLLTREDTHPALRQLLAQVAQKQHDGAGWFNRAREFPNTRTSELPVSAEGDRAINGRPSLLNRYLPFWISSLLERMWLVLGILLAVLFPLSRVVPPMYEFRVRSRVFRKYQDLQEIEARYDLGKEDAAALLAEVNALEVRVEKISVPLSHTEELYTLRNHIHLVRKKLLARINAADTGNGTATPTSTPATKAP